MEKLKRFFSSLMFGLMAVCAMTLSACGDDHDDVGSIDIVGTWHATVGN